MMDVGFPLCSLGRRRETSVAMIKEPVTCYGVLAIMNLASDHGYCKSFGCYGCH